MLGAIAVAVVAVAYPINVCAVIATATYGFARRMMTGVRSAVIRLIDGVVVAVVINARTQQARTQRVRRIRQTQDSVLVVKILAT